jgi:hypothetical protein
LHQNRGDEVLRHRMLFLFDRRAFDRIGVRLLVWQRQTHRALGGEDVHVNAFLQCRRGLDDKLRVAACKLDFIQSPPALRAVIG